jgi:hypothetical protein
LAAKDVQLPEKYVDFLEAVRLSNKVMKVAHHLPT